MAPEGDKVTVGPRRRFRYLEPTFCSGLFDDPLLYLYVRPLGQGLLFDCGQIHHLAKRILKSITAIFISHAHMDHFMGMDSFIRHNHVSPRTVDIFGPPDIALKMAHKFSGYDWNLREDFWCRFVVHEVHRDKIASFLFSGAEGFVCQPLAETPRGDRIIYRNAYLRVESDLCDHKIPTLIFRITEEPAFSIDVEKLKGEGLARGDWLRSLKKRFFTGALPGPLAVVTTHGVERTVDGTELYSRIAGREMPAAIGYVTDVAFTADNVKRIMALLEGISLLACECSFLRLDVEKARESHHLCTSDINTLLARLHPCFFVPMHLSKTYLGRSCDLFFQLQPPADVTVVHLPERLTPRPGLPEDFLRLPPPHKMRRPPS